MSDQPRFELDSRVQHTKTRDKGNVVGYIRTEHGYMHLVAWDSGAMERVPAEELDYPDDE